MQRSHRRQPLLTSSSALSFPASGLGAPNVPPWLRIGAARTARAISISHSELYVRAEHDLRSGKQRFTASPEAFTLDNQAWLAGRA
jgi:hypothetical protein